MNKLHVIPSILIGIFLLVCGKDTAANNNVDQQTGSTLIGIEALTASELLSQGVDAMSNGEYIQSRKYLDYAIVKALGSDSMGIAILATNNIGNLYYYLNEPDSALHYYYRALDWAEKEEDLETQNTLNNNIGIIYASTDHPLEARAVIDKALAISILLNDTNKMSKNLINLGNQEIQIGNYTLAKEHLIRAEKLLNRQGSNDGLWAIYINLGNIEFADSNYVEALNLYSKGKSILPKMHLKDQVRTEINIGRTLIFLQEFEKADSVLSQALELAQKGTDLNAVSDVLLWSSESQKAQNQMTAANDLLWEIISIKDSIILLEKKNWIEQSKTKHQFELKQREFEIFTENAKKRTFLIRILFIGLLVIILLLAYILRMRIISSKQKEKLHQEENIRNTQKLQRAKSKNKELKQTIETINYELVSKTLLIDNKNQILESVGTIIKDAERSDTSGDNQQVSQLKQHLLRDHNVEQNWEDFKMYFERVNTDFFKNIHQTYPKLTSNDLRLMAFLLLEFNSKEIAQILNISPDSVRKRKQRLKEKLQLQKSDDLLNHLYSFT